MRKLAFLTSGLFLAFATWTNAQDKKADEGYKFTDVKRLPTTVVKSQDRAGTCWSWSTISFLESEMMRLGKDSVSLSPLYVVWNHVSWQSRQIRPHEWTRQFRTRRSFCRCYLGH